MREHDLELLKENGWTVECESPFEIRHEDGSFATGQAAKMVLEGLRGWSVEPAEGKEGRTKDGRCHAHCQTGCQYKAYGKCFSEEECEGQYVKKTKEEPAEAKAAPEVKGLQDTDKMPFGKYARSGTLMQDVPADYFHYLWTHGLEHDRVSPVAEYIRRNLNALKKEHPDGIW